MSFSNVTARFALSFLLLIISLVLVLSISADLNSYAESDDDNKNNENKSSLSPFPSSSISDIKEPKKSKALIDTNTSSLLSSSSASPSDSSNETSNDKPQVGTLVVTKQVINDGGGTKSPSDFIITINGNNPTPSSFRGSSSGTTVELSKGKYEVTESGSIANYNSTLSNECSGTINVGETKKCTIINTYSASPPPPFATGKIIVIKRVINDGGGTKSPSDFIITINGNNPTPSSFAGSSSGTTITLKPGSYSVTETGPPGYTADYSDGCNGNVKAGSINKCTITNTFQPVPESAQLIIIKNVINNNNDIYGSVVKPSAFTITVHGNNPLPRSFPGKSGDGVIVNLEPGKYSITEEGPSGYTTDYSDSCQGSISSGEAKACVITNQAIMPPQPRPPSPVPNKPLLPVTETIKGFSVPYGIALNIDNDLLYVSNYGQFNTTGIGSVLNGTTNTIVATIPVGKNPQAIAYNPANGLLYVANALSDTLSIINGTSNSLIGSIPLGDYPGKSPTGIAVNPINNTIYVTNMGSNTVSVINGTSNALVETIPIGLGPYGIAYNQNNGNVYVANSLNGTISVINGLTNTVNTTFLIGINNTPTGILYDPNNETIFTTNTNSNTLSVIKNQ